MADRQSNKTNSKLIKCLTSCSFAGALLMAGCDTPGESAGAAGLLGGLVGGAAGGSVAGALVGAAAAGLVTYAVQSSYEASEAQKQAAKVQAQEIVANMPAETKAKTEKVLVPVAPSSEHPEANQELVYDRSTGEVGKMVLILPEPPKSKTFVKLSSGEEVYVN